MHLDLKAFDYLLLRAYY